MNDDVKRIAALGLNSLKNGDIGHHNAAGATLLVANAAAPPAARAWMKPRRPPARII